jgi:hypothetical protein
MFCMFSTIMIEYSCIFSEVFVKMVTVTLISLHEYRKRVLLNMEH